MKVTNRFVLPVLALALLLATVPAVQAGGFNLAGVGAKALSMSGAFRGVADDWSAMYWNPAGLAGQPSGAILEAKLLYPMTWVTPNAPSTTPGYDGYYLYTNGEEASSEPGAHPAGAAAFQWQFSERLTAGAALFFPSALGAEWADLYQGPYYGYYDPGEGEYPDVAWSSDMLVADFHPTIAYAVLPNLKLGAGLGIKYSQITLQTPVITPAINPDTFTRLPMPAHHFFVDAVLEGSGWGFGFNVGALYEPIENLSLGVSYSGPTTIPLEGNVTQTLHYASLAGGGTDVVEPSATADFPLPQELGAGVAYKLLNEQLTLAFDASWTNWERLDVITLDLEGDGLGGREASDSELRLHWENTIRYSAGVNYAVSPGGLEVRAGYYFDPSPIPDETMRPTITDVADKSSLSIGLAYPVGRSLLLEGYWEHLFSGENTVDIAYADDGSFENVPGDWHFQVDTFGFQLTYRF